MNRTAHRTYGTQQVMTSSPLKLIALLYDRAIVSLKEAVQAIERADVQARWKANNKAVEIITHLASTLDHEAGGEVAENLDQLYLFMLERLFEVDQKNDPQAARDVIALLEPLRDSWRQLAENAPGAAAGTAGAKPSGSNESLRDAATDMAAQPDESKVGTINLSA